MKRCSRCVMPDTRPDVPFTDGVCQACLTYAIRPKINWGGRKDDLKNLLDRHNGRCIVPSSGGKDSSYQVMKLLELGADVTVVTASTCHLTHIGRENIDNLARHARTIEITPNRTVRGKLNRLGLDLVGDISWPEHVAIFTTPFRVAADLGIPLIFYGENPQNQYGGPPGSEEARQLTQRWRSEYGGFLGLRPADMVGQMGITERDMADYELPRMEPVINSKIEAHFLGQYLPWDSHENARVASAAGMRHGTPSQANWWPWENLDNAQTGLHDHMMYRKYGYGRGCAQISVDIRTGRMHRERALDWVKENDGKFPNIYAGVSFSTMLDSVDMPCRALTPILDRFTNWELFDPSAIRSFGSHPDWPILKEFV